MDRLGQTSPSNADAAAWGEYLTALRSSIQTSWAGARQAYLTLKRVREQLGFPFISPVTGGEGGLVDNGGWSDSLESNMQDLQAMVKVTDDAFGDVLAQKRKLLYDAKTNDFAVEGLPSDVVRVRLTNGNLSLVDGTGNTIHVTGTIGVAPVILIGGVAAVALSGAVTFVAAGLVIKKTCDTVQAIAEQKTMQTALTKQAELVQSGKATPEQAAAMTKSVYDGATALATAKGKAEENSDTSKITKTVTTVALIGLGIGVIYLLAKLIPEGGLKRSPAMLENPSEKLKWQTFAGGTGAHHGNSYAAYLSGNRSWHINPPSSRYAGYNLKSFGVTKPYWVNHGNYNSPQQAKAAASRYMRTGSFVP